MVRKTNDYVASGGGSRRRRYRKKSALPLRQKKEVQSMISSRLREKPEKKYLDHDQTATLVGSSVVGTPVVVPLSDVTQGINNQERIGAEIQPVFLGMRYRVTGDPGSTVSTCAVRVMIIRWRNNDLTTPVSFNNILQNIAFPWSYYNKNTTKDFTSLYDAKHVLSNNQSNSEYNAFNEVSIDWKKLKTPIQYDSGATTGTDNLYLVAISDVGSLGNRPILTYNTRLLFTDC